MDLLLGKYMVMICFFIAMKILPFGINLKAVN